MDFVVFSPLHKHSIKIIFKYNINSGNKQGIIAVIIIFYYFYDDLTENIGTEKIMLMILNGRNRGCLVNLKWAIENVLTWMCVCCWNLLTWILPLELEGINFICFSGRDFEGQLFVLIFVSCFNWIFTTIFWSRVCLKKTFFVVKFKKRHNGRDQGESVFLLFL